MAPSRRSLAFLLAAPAKHLRDLVRNTCSPRNRLALGTWPRRARDPRAGLAGHLRPDLDRHARLDADLLAPLLSLDHARRDLPITPSQTVDHVGLAVTRYHDVAGGSFTGMPHVDGDRSLRHGRSRPLARRVWPDSSSVSMSRVCREPAHVRSSHRHCWWSPQRWDARVVVPRL